MRGAGGEWLPILQQSTHCQLLLLWLVCLGVVLTPSCSSPCSCAHRRKRRSQRRRMMRKTVLVCPWKRLGQTRDLARTVTCLHKSTSAWKSNAGADHAPSMRPNPALGGACLALDLGISYRLPDSTSLAYCIYRTACQSSPAPPLAESGASAGEEAACF